MENQVVQAKNLPRKSDPNQRKVSEMFYKQKSPESTSCEDSVNNNLDRHTQDSVQIENQENSTG